MRPQANARRAVLRRLVTGVLLLGGCAGASTTTLPRHRAEGEPVVYRAVVLRVSGPAPVEHEDTCRVEVFRVTGPHFNCRIRIRCGEDRLYGLPDAGYNDCKLEEGRAVYARDAYGTRADGDPSMTFDTRRGHVVVSDRDPEIDIILGLDQRGPPPGMDPEVPPGY